MELRSFYRRAFDPVLKRVEVKLDQLTESGTKPGLIRATAKTILTDVPIKLKMLTEQNVLTQCYPNGFQAGNYCLEMNRGLLIVLVHAVRAADQNRWFFDFRLDKAEEMLKINVQIAQGINNSPVMTKTFKQGNFAANFFVADQINPRLI